MKGQIQILKMELRFIRIFLLYMENWRDVSKGESSQSLLTRIEASLSSAAEGIYGADLLAMYKRKMRDWGLAVSNLLEKINHLKQEIRLACDVWCECSLQIKYTVNSEAAVEFLDPLFENLDSLVELKADMTLSVKKQFEALKENLQFLRDLINFTSNRSNEHAKWENLLTLFGTVSSNAACLSYMCWVDEKIGDGTNVMLSNLLQFLKPNTSEVIEMYLGLLKASNPARYDLAFKHKVVENVVDFLFENLVVHVEYQFNTLREQLVLLIMYLMDSLGEKTQYREKMLVLTEVVINEAQSLIIHSFKIDLTTEEMQSEVSLLLTKLHEKVKFAIVEVFLTELLKHNSDWMVLVKDYTNALHEGLRFLIDVLMDPPEKSTEDWQLMLVHMEEVAKEAGALIDTVDGNQMTEKLVMEMNLQLVKLFDNIKLIKQLELLIKLLIHLRYLAIRGSFRALPASIVNLWNLETLLVKGLRGEIKLPGTFWNMTRLRHVQLLGRVRIMVDYKYDEDESSILFNPETLTTPSFHYSSRGEVRSILRRLPRLRKLRCVLLESWDNGGFPELDLLLKLESLKVLNHGYLRYPCHFHLPNSLKKLTLSKFRLPWDAITEIGSLPNVEVLKLLNQAFRGHKWDMKAGEFEKLRYLKLNSLDIVEWDASTEQFPCLEQLVLDRCEYLEEIPSCLREIPTLELLQVHWCSSSTANAARDIEEEQLGNGNEVLKVLIYP